MALMKGIDQEQAAQDALAAADLLRGLAGGLARIGAVGYCIGGKLAYLMAMHSGFEAAASCYGIATQASPDRAAGARMPLLPHLAEDDKRNLLIVNPALGAALADHLGGATVALMRGHGFTTIGNSVPLAAYHAIYTAKNCEVQQAALSLGEWDAAEHEPGATRVFERRPTPIDHATMASFWATMKTELIDGPGSNTRAQARRALFDHDRSVLLAHGVGLPSPPPPIHFIRASSPAHRANSAPPFLPDGRGPRATSARSVAGTPVGTTAKPERARSEIIFRAQGKLEGLDASSGHPRKTGVHFQLVQVGASWCEKKRVAKSKNPASR